jgi:hypothetical protein
MPMLVKRELCNQPEEHIERCAYQPAADQVRSFLADSLPIALVSTGVLQMVYKKVANRALYRLGWRNAPILRRFPRLCQIPSNISQQLREPQSAIGREERQCTRQS